MGRDLHQTSDSKVLPVGLSLLALSGSTLGGCITHLERANAELSESDKRRAELDAALATKKEEIAEISTELDTARAEERKRVSTDADSDKRLEQILSKRAQHLSKQDRLVKQIRELGALPKGFEDHSKTGLKKL